MAFKVSPFHKQANGSPFQIKSPLRKGGPDDNNTTTPPSTEEKVAKSTSYDSAYDALSDEKKAEYRKSDKAGDGKGRARFTEAAKAYNKKSYGTEEPTKAAKEGKLSDTQKKKLSSEKEEYKKKREVTAKDKTDAETKTKVEPKTKTGKQRRAEKRVGRLKKKQDKGKTLSASQEKKLSRNRSKAAGEKVKDEDKTKVGKTIKKGVDKVKDVVSKDSPAEMNMDSKRKKIERKTKKIDRISSRAAKAGGKGNEKRATRLSAKAVGKTAERNFLVEDYNSKIDNPKNSKYVSNK
jgi:hypothetical protein